MLGNYVTAATLTKTTILKVHSVTEKVVRLNVFATHFAQNFNFPESKWFPTIGQQIIFQEAVINTKYLTMERRLNTIINKIWIHCYEFFLRPK